MGAIYSNTLARINMGRLLDTEKLKRLTEADYPAALKILADYGYGDGAAGEDVDKVLTRETNSLISFIEEDCVNPHAAKALLNRFYYNNAKALYKSRFVTVDLASALYSVDLDLSGIKGGDYSALDPYMTEALESLDAASETPAPKAIDLALTKAMYADCLREAKRSRSKTLYKYFVSEIDLNNILTVMRAKTLRIPTEAAAEMLVAGGTIDADTLLTALISETSNLANVISGTPYDELIGGFVEHGFAFAAQFETGSDDYLYLLTESGAVSLDKFDVFLRYVLAQLTEFKMVKMILVCVKNGVKGEIEARTRRFDD